MVSQQHLQILREQLSVQLAGTGAEFNQDSPTIEFQHANINWFLILQRLIFNGDITDQQRSEIHAYLSQKWGLTATVDSGDGFTDAVEAAAGSSVTAATDKPCGHSSGYLQMGT